MSQNPVISIVVITYNSSKYIIETLESAIKQTYRNIELIISDDGSQDNTVEICRNWSSVNKERFVNLEIVVTDKNTGISGNCNRGVKASRGEWIKLIAGDDLLISDSIEQFVKYISLDEAIEVVYSKSLGFFGDISNANYGTYHFPGYSKFYNSTADIQFKMLMRRNYCDGPTIFFKKSTFELVGGFDERFKFEDYPFALRLVSNNIKLHYMDIYTVYYRENIVSITRTGDDKLFSDFYLETEKFNRAEVYPYCNLFIKLAKKIEFSRLQFFSKVGLNRKTKFSRLLFLSSYYLNPLHTFNKYY